MAVDTAPPRSRRALLAACLGAAAASIGSAVGRPALVRAADPHDVVLGATNTSDTTTRINYNGAGTAFRTASTSGIGIHGDSAGNYGVAGSSTTTHGVYGTSTNEWGVYGSGDYGGVYGDTTSTIGKGVYGYAGTGADSVGVEGDSPAGTGVMGVSNLATAVRGASTSGFGVFGTSHANVAVYGRSASNNGLYGLTYSTTRPAVLGWSFKGSAAIQGYSGGNTPTVEFVKTGVVGSADQDASSVGVRGYSTPGCGGVFSGGVAQLRLMAASATTHPASGGLGDLFLDRNKRLWFCKGGSTWVQLA